MNVSGGNVTSWGQLRRIPRGRRTVIGIVLAIVLVGGLGFVSVKLFQDHGITSGQPTTPAPPESLAIPGCYNPSVPPTERPKKLNVVGCASVAVALQDMSWTSWGPQGADGTGLGLYVSRAIVRSCRGELRYEARTAGCCFAVVLAPLAEA